MQKTVRKSSFLFSSTVIITSVKGLIAQMKAELKRAGFVVIYKIIRSRRAIG